MKSWCLGLLLLIAAAAMPAYTQNADGGFQTASVVSIDRVPADARHPENADQYKISMRMGNTIYMCHALGTPALFLGWSPGKEYPTQLDGKVMHVKGPNGPVDLNIVGKKTPK